MKLSILSVIVLGILGGCGVETAPESTSSLLASKDFAVLEANHPGIDPIDITYKKRSDGTNVEKCAIFYDCMRWGGKSEPQLFITSNKKSSDYARVGKALRFRKSRTENQTLTVRSRVDLRNVTGAEFGDHSLILRCTNVPLDLSRVEQPRAIRGRLGEEAFSRSTNRSEKDFNNYVVGTWILSQQNCFDGDYRLDVLARTSQSVKFLSLSYSLFSGS